MSVHIEILIKEEVSGHGGGECELTARVYKKQVEVGIGEITNNLEYFKKYADEVVYEITILGVSLIDTSKKGTRSAAEEAEEAAEEKEAAKAEEEAAKAEEANDEWARSSGNLYMISTPMERARSKREREKERALDKAANKREKQYEDENRRHREIMNRIESESKKRVKEIKAEFKKSLQDDWNRIQNAEEAAKAEEKANK
jgi:hypothetical protein